MNNRIMLLFVLILIPFGGCSDNGDRSVGKKDNKDGYARYSHTYPCGYKSYLFELLPCKNSFELEQHALKWNENDRRYILKINYGCSEPWDDSAMHDKTGEKKGWYLHSDAEPPASVLFEKVFGVEIVSSEVFNGIPAGETLNSKLMMFTCSAWPNIEAGELLKFHRGGPNDYYYQYFHFNPIPYNMYPMTKMMDELEEEDLYYLDAYYPVYFLFMELPEIKSHVFTVKYIMEDRILTLDIPADFEE